MSARKIGRAALWMRAPMLLWALAFVGATLGYVLVISFLTRDSEGYGVVAQFTLDNYRRLLSFVDSAPYQIYIMGHSCGNSDRTLLNTLFEHRNCVSIKPYYHLKEDGTDNYIEIIQNISRNFNDMQLMRDRVVNKSYCRPLVPAGIRQ